MVQSMLRVAAARHRLVASLLTDPCDRAIINQYADEVEDLTRLEVKAAYAPSEEAPAIARAEFGGNLRKIFDPAPSSSFDALIEGLNAPNCQLIGNF